MGKYLLSFFIEACVDAFGFSNTNVESKELLITFDCTVPFKSNVIIRY